MYSKSDWGVGHWLRMVTKGIRVALLIVLVGSAANAQRQLSRGGSGWLTKLIAVIAIAVIVGFLALWVNRGLTAWRYRGWPQLALVYRLHATWMLWSVNHFAGTLQLWQGIPTASATDPEWGSPWLQPFCAAVNSLEQLSTVLHRYAEVQGNRRANVVFQWRSRSRVIGISLDQARQVVRFAEQAAARLRDVKDAAPAPLTPFSLVSAVPRLKFAPLTEPVQRLIAQQMKNRGGRLLTENPTFGAGQTGYAHYWRYVLLLENGWFYVGVTAAPIRRLREHLSGNGSQVTHAHRVFGWLELEDLGMTTYQKAEILEDERTLALMQQFGLTNVRGGHWAMRGTEDLLITTLQQRETIRRKYERNVIGDLF